MGRTQLFCHLTGYTCRIRVKLHSSSGLTIFVPVGPFTGKTLLSGRTARKGSPWRLPCSAACVVTCEPRSQQQQQMNAKGYFNYLKLD